MFILNIRILEIILIFTLSNYNVTITHSYSIQSFIDRINIYE